MNRLKYFLIIIISLIPSISKSQDYCEFILEIQEYQDFVKLKSVGNNDIIDSSSFSITTYLSYFDNIEVEEGYKIGVYYFDNFLDGNPYLYANLENKELNEKVDKESLYELLNSEKFRAKNHIKPKNTEIGFLQYLFFSEMGEQFALKWHANYNEKYIICSREELDEIIIELQTDNKEVTDNEKIDSGYSVDSIGLNRLEKINPEIVIESKNDFYIITWIENRTHSGIYRCVYQVQQKVPYRIDKINEEKLIDTPIDFLY